MRASLLPCAALQTAPGEQDGKGSDAMTTWESIPPLIRFAVWVVAVFALFWFAANVYVFIEAVVEGVKW